MKTIQKPRSTFDESWVKDEAWKSKQRELTMKAKLRAWELGISGKAYREMLEKLKTLRRWGIKTSIRYKE